MKLSILCFCASLLFSCGDGYEKIDGNWSWVNNNEGGKQVTEIKADNSTFEILEFEQHAKDLQRVYWKGHEIENADPKTFEVLNNNGFAKDKNNVYLQNEIVILANPRTFSVLEWPYSRDDKRIFNGNLPMKVDDINEFEVVNSDQTTSFYTKSFFVKLNQDYDWLDSLSVVGIIVGETAEAKTKHEKYKGYRKVK
jgi:hypothetical protein